MTPFSGNGCEQYLHDVRTRHCASPSSAQGDDNQKDAAAVNNKKNSNTNNDGTGDIGPYDVLCGRHKLAFHNVGNRRLRVTISCFLPAYQAAKTRADKSNIIQQVVQIIHTSGGRFLKFCPHSQTWTPLSPRKSHEKCSHAFRDRVAAQAQQQQRQERQQQQLQQEWEQEGAQNQDHLQEKSPSQEQHGRPTPALAPVEVVSSSDVCPDVACSSIDNSNSAKTISEDENQSKQNLMRTPPPRRVSEVDDFLSEDQHPWTTTSMNEEPAWNTAQQDQDQQQRPVALAEEHVQQQATESNCCGGEISVDSTRSLVANAVSENHHCGEDDWMLSSFLVDWGYLHNKDHYHQCAPVSLAPQEITSNNEKLHCKGGDEQQVEDLMESVMESPPLDFFHGDDHDEFPIHDTAAFCDANYEDHWERSLLVEA